MDRRRIFLSGHRGYKALEIENTLRAFLRAIKEGIDYVEFDVKKTKDNIPVIFHDEFLHRLLGVKGRISDFTLRELKRYKYKDGQEILTLEEYFSIAGKKIRHLLEIKSLGIEHKIIKLIRSHDLESRVIIQSFNGNVIKRCCKLQPDLDYGLCIGPVGNLGSFGVKSGLHYLMGGFAYLLLIKPYPVQYLNLDGPYVNDEFVNFCLKKGKKIILGAKKTWLYLDKIQDWGIEIINCDNPSHIKRLLIEKGWRFG
ncbi:MAG: glycerophosphodiester phosphodiesterase [Promethearchaeota archaeon]